MRTYRLISVVHCSSAALQQSAAGIAMVLRDVPAYVGLEFAYIITPVLGNDTMIEIRLFRGNFTIADLSAYYIDNLRFLVVEGHVLSVGINAVGLGVVMRLSDMQLIFGSTWPQFTCTGCRKLVAREDFQKCGGCYLARYCSKQCQLRDWRAGHKLACGQLGSAYRAARRDLHCSHLPVACGYLSEYDYMLFCHLVRFHAQERGS